MRCSKWTCVYCYLIVRATVSAIWLVALQYAYLCFIVYLIRLFFLYEVADKYNTIQYNTIQYKLLLAQQCKNYSSRLRFGRVVINYTFYGPRCTTSSLATQAHHEPSKCLPLNPLCIQGGSKKVSCCTVIDISIARQ